MTEDRAHGGHGQAREILRLAVPAFLALVAEPLFLLADSAIVGNLGTAALAGLGIASAVLLTAVNIFIFLAYGTTAVVARRLGAGDERGAVSAGIDGVWLALLLGAVGAVFTALLAQPLVQLFGAGDAVVAEAVTYLRWSALGIPSMLVVLAARKKLVLPRSFCRNLKYVLLEWLCELLLNNLSSSSPLLRLQRNLKLTLA